MDLTIIQSKIYEIRGQRVMLDFDLATLYQVETKNLKKAVRRNPERFPPDFMFELTNTEWSELIISLQFQDGTANLTKNRALPFVFTQEGIAMLSSVLHSSLAIQININIMRAFVRIRKFTINPVDKRVEVLEIGMKELKQYIEEVFSDYNDINEDTAMQLELINQTLAELSTAGKALSGTSLLPERKKIGYK